MPLFRRFAVALLVTALALPSPATAQKFDLPPPDARPNEAVSVLTLPPDSVFTDKIDIGQEIEAAFKAADAFPEKRYELAALVESLGKEPVAAFTWVRDTIMFDPYGGHLRDPEGVMAAGGGNSVDRSGLLKALFDAMGLKARFAVGNLDDLAREELVANVFASRSANGAPDAEGAFKPEFLSRVRARAGRDFALLAETLGADAIASMNAKTANIDPAALRQHVWVQAEISGVWKNFDTSMTSAQPGDILAPATETFDVLDTSLAQTVTFEVSATLSSGEQPLLTETLPAAVAANKQILLYFEPAKSGVSAVLAGGSSFRPVLLVGGEATNGEQFDTGGDGGMIGAIDALGDGGAANSPLRALTLKIRTSGPGQPTRDAIRLLGGTFEHGTLASDAQGPLALRWIHNIVVSNGGQSPRNFAIVKAVAMEYAVRELSSESLLAKSTVSSLLWPMTSANLVLPTVSERLFIEGMNGAATRAFVAEPRVFIASVGPGASEDNQFQGFTIDLALDRVSIVTQAGRNPSELRLWYGALQSALETEFGLLRLATTEAQGRRITSASTVIDAAPLKLIRSDENVGDAPAEIKLALAAGLRVILAGKSSEAKAWWTIAADGATNAVLQPALGGVLGGGRMPHTSNFNSTNYVNSSGGQSVYELDLETGETISETRSDGKVVRYKKPGPARSSNCKGGNEYTVVANCHSVPSSLHLGVWTAAAVISWVVAYIFISRAL